MMSGDDSSGSSSDSDDFVDASQGPPTSFTSSGSGLSSQGGLSQGGLSQGGLSNEGGNIEVDHSVVDTSPMMNAASQPLGEGAADLLSDAFRDAFRDKVRSRLRPL